MSNITEIGTFILVVELIQWATNYALSVLMGVQRDKTWFAVMFLISIITMIISRIACIYLLGV